MDSKVEIAYEREKMKFEQLKKYVGWSKAAFYGLCWAMLVNLILMYALIFHGQPNKPNIDTCVPFCPSSFQSNQPSLESCAQVGSAIRLNLDSCTQYCASIHPQNAINKRQPDKITRGSAESAPLVIRVEKTKELEVRNNQE
jgi:hypothetical protein